MTQSGDIKDTEEEVRRRRSSKGVGEGAACERNNAAGGENETIEEIYFYCWRALSNQTVPCQALTKIKKRTTTKIKK